MEKPLANINPKLIKKMGQYLLRGWDENHHTQNGANLVDIINKGIRGAALNNDTSLLQTLSSAMSNAFSFMTKHPTPENQDEREAMAGLLVDFSFSQHSSFGPLWY